MIDRALRWLIEGRVTEMEKVTSEQLKAAWQKAEDAWQAAGADVPCYEINYMIARKELADLHEKAERQAQR